MPANWAELPDEELLNLRLSDLPIKLDGTAVEARIGQLNAELAARGLKFPLHFYLSDDWFTPPEIFAVHGPTFDLDPCSPPAPATTRRRIYTKADDGLKLGPHQLLVPARRLGRIRRGRRLIDRS